MYMYAVKLKVKQQRNLFAKSQKIKLCRSWKDRRHFHQEPDDQLLPKSRKMYASAPRKEEGHFIPILQTSPPTNTIRHKAEPANQ